MPTERDSSSVWTRGGAWLIHGSAAVAVAFLVAFTILVSLRAFYPYELEWIEGVNLDEILWIAEGHPAFGPPRVEFIPILYTPLYFGVSAVFVELLGAGFLAPRLVSILASLGCFALLFRIVRRETGKVTAGMVAAGLYAATFFVTGKWMDLAKVDSLFLFLVLSAFAIGRNARDDEARSVRWLIASGVVWAAAYFTKQLTLPIAALFMPFSLIATRGRSWVQWSSALAAGLSAFWILDERSDGWFSFFALSTFTRHSFDPGWQFWKLLLSGMWPAALLAALYAVQLVRRVSIDRTSLFGNGLLVAGFALALVSSSWAVYMKKWTYLNGLMPACLGLALLAGIAAGRAIVWWEAGHGRGAHRSAGWRCVGLAACMGLVLLQLGLLVRHPSLALPTPDDRAAARAFVDRISRLPGTVLIYDHGYYGRLAGKGAYFNSTVMGDVLGNDRPGSAEFNRRRQQVQEVHDRAVSEQRFDWVVVDQPEASWSPWFLYVDRFELAPGAFYPVTGAKARPESLMRKNPVARGGAYPLTDRLWNRYFLGNWSKPQPWGRWIRGPARQGPAQAGLQMALSAEADYDLRIGMALDCDAGAPTREAGAGAVRVDVAWNTRSVGSEQLSGCEEQTVSIRVGRETIGGGLNELHFRLTAAAERYRVRVTRVEVARR